MLLIAPDGSVVLANQAACGLFGFDLDDLVRMSVDDLLPESLRIAHARHRSTYGRHPRRREMGSGLELVGVRSDGAEVPVEISLSPLRIRGEHHVIAAVRDVTRRRADEEALTETRRRLTQTSEQERIGRDLHDTVLQRLYGAGLGLQAALATDDATLRRRAERALGEIDDTISEIRSVILDLHRVVDGSGGLGARIQTLTHELAETYGLTATVHVVGFVDADVDRTVIDAAIAVVHESLSNVGRHAHATSVTVDVEIDVDNELSVTVSDDGIGFDLESAPRGAGLDNISARATELEGVAEVTSSPDHGTNVCWRVPIHPAK